MYYGYPFLLRACSLKACSLKTCLSQERHANRIFLARCAALLFLLFSLTLFTACGSSSSNTAATTPPAPAPVPAPSAPASLTISANLPAAVVNAAYNGSLTVTGGTEPYRFSVASGQLPNGLSLADSGGTISGTPAAAGTFTFNVSVSDSKGLSQQQSLQIAVANSTNNPPAGAAGSSGANSFSKVQKSGGWNQFGQQGPNYIDCSPSPCDGISFSMTQGVNSPSMSGDASEFNVGGSVPFSDGLWNNHLIGPSSSQGLPDNNGTLIPSLHNFTYDVYFYGNNLGLAQALEFDINQFFGNMGFIWGHECRIASGNEWDVWNNQKKYWVHTGIPCYPNNNSWNHLTIKVQRTSNNQLFYQSITLNGVTNNVNQYYNPGSAVGWYGVTINYQEDGNSKQSPYSVYLDNLTFSYQ